MRPGALWRFCRPHTVVGSAVSLPALTVFSGAPLVPTASSALAPTLLVNLYVVGLNQLFDVSIDRINKPWLPLASGEMSVMEGALVVVLALAGAGVLARGASSALKTVLGGSALLGTLYSVPPFRLKRHPLAAALLIVAVRGVLVNLCFCANAGAPLGAATWACVAFYTCFSVVIAAVKDVPDVRGDATHGILSYAARWGPVRVLRGATALLVSALTVASVALWSYPLHAAGAIALAAGVWWRSTAVDVEDTSSVRAFYMFLWACFYASYGVLTCFGGTATKRYRY